MTPIEKARALAASLSDERLAVTAAVFAGLIDGQSIPNDESNRRILAVLFAEGKRRGLGFAAASAAADLKLPNLAA